MKRLISCILIVAGIIVFSIYGCFYSENVETEIKSTIGELKTEFKNGNFMSAESIAGQAQEKWHSLSENTIFIEDRECDCEIMMSLARIREMCRTQDDDIYIECAVLEELLEMYSSRQKPVLTNIF